MGPGGSLMLAFKPPQVLFLKKHKVAVVLLQTQLQGCCPAPPIFGCSLRADPHVRVPNACISL